MATIETEIKTGESRIVGNLVLTPQTQVLKIQIPRHHASLIWNRPKGVVVRTPEGQEQFLPVTDVTRIAIWTMLAGGLLGAILMGLMFRHK